MSKASKTRWRERRRKHYGFSKHWDQLLSEIAENIGISKKSLARQYKNYVRHLKASFSAVDTREFMVSMPIDPKKER